MAYLLSAFFRHILVSGTRLVWLYIVTWQFCGKFITSTYCFQCYAPLWLPASPSCHGWCLVKHLVPGRFYYQLFKRTNVLHPDLMYPKLQAEVRHTAQCIALECWWRDLNEPTSDKHSCSQVRLASLYTLLMRHSSRSSPLCLIVVSR